MQSKTIIRILAVFLCLFSLAANAAHHRGQALDFIDDAQLSLLIGKSVAVNYQAACELNPADETSINVILSYSTRVQSDMDLVSAILEDPAGNLDDARRIMNQPNNAGFTSVSIRMRGLLHRGGMLVGACPEQNTALRSILQRLTNAWLQSERVMWHITDAIREEIYEDPDFQ